MPASVHSDNYLLSIKVTPNASRNEITGLRNGVLQVKIAAPPVKGKANKELAAFLSRLLRVSKSSVSIVKGYTSHNKVIAIAGLSQEDIMRRLSH